MRGIVAALLLLPAAASAGRILDSSVTLDDGVYSKSVEADIAAPADTVFRFITDYDHLNTINPAIRESRITRTYGPDRHRVRTVIRACILFFCRSVLQVQDMQQHGGRRLEADIIPGLSDFRQGRAEWILAGSGGSTTMYFEAELEPDFWVPPVIGPWLFRNKIVSELLESAAWMEADAATRVMQ